MDVSNNTCSVKKASDILKLVKEDGQTMKEYQEMRNFLVRSIVREIEFKKEGNEIHRERIKTASKSTRLSIRDDAGNRACDSISINS